MFINMKKVLSLYVGLLMIMSFSLLLISSSINTLNFSKVEKGWSNLAFTIYAQENDTDEEETITVMAPLLDTVSRNNEVIELDEEGKINASHDDPIKIAGIAKAGDTVTVFVSDKEYTAVADKNGNWFVLFSVTDLGDKEYLIEAQSRDKDDNLSKKVELFTLGARTKAATTNDSATTEGKETLLQRLTKGDLRYVSIILFSLFLIGLILFLTPFKDKKEKTS